MLDWNQTAALIWVIREGSFSRAAKTHRIQKSTLSRRVASLEEQLGFPLIRRTTRKFDLTPEGEIYYNNIKSAFETLERAHTQIQQNPNAITGHVRITAPVILGQVLLPEIIAKFSKKYPAITIELILEDKVMDFLTDRIDIAFRAGKIEGNIFKSLRLGSTEFAFYASPIYLSQRKDPILKPQALAAHSLVSYIPDDEEFPWHLVHKSGQRFKLKVDQAKIKVNTLHLAKELVKQQAGIALLPTFLCHEELASLELIRVLSDWTAEKSYFSLVYMDQKIISPAVKTAIHFLKTELKIPERIR